MILARDVVRQDGMVLSGKGTPLSETLIDRLKRLDIQSVTVEGHPVADEGGRTLEGELADLEERFSRQSGDPTLMLIKHAIKDIIVASWQ